MAEGDGEKGRKMSYGHRVLGQLSMRGPERQNEQQKTGAGWRTRGTGKGLGRRPERKGGQGPVGREAKTSSGPHCFHSNQARCPGPGGARGLKDHV